MASGLQMFDANGTITLDISDRVARFVGQVDVPLNSSGSVNVPEFGQAGVTPFFIVQTASEGDSAYVYWNSTSINWNYENSLSAQYVACTVYYGVF